MASTKEETKARFDRALAGLAQTEPGSEEALGYLEALMDDMAFVEVLARAAHTTTEVDDWFDRVWE